jgi:hypothetical protein
MPLQYMHHYYNARCLVINALGGLEIWRYWSLNVGALMKTDKSASPSAMVGEPVKLTGNALVAEMLGSLLRAGHRHW